MKGIVFTELLDMVEARHGPQELEGLLEDTALPHGGAYTSVGTYPAQEMVALVHNLSRRTGIPSEGLLQAFGSHLFGRFYERFPDMMDRSPDALSFLMGIESLVHAEVRKLYPDAQLPLFETQRMGTDSIRMEYSSFHDFSALAHGLIQGCAAHYKRPLTVNRTPAKRVGDRVHVSFEVTFA
jgi:hypothetical protein